MAQFPSDSSASGIWTLKKQKRAIQGENWPGRPVYIENVFSTWLYTGTGASQTITNGIDLSGKGGLVWTKDRSTTGSHWLIDTNRGRDYVLISNGTNDQLVGFNGNLSSFNSNGYSLTTGYPNNSSTNYVSWTFRKQAKFFDVVTYTGNGSNRTIAHSLGSVPGCILVKRTDSSGAWAVYHRSLANTEYMVLDTTAAKATGATYWNSTTPTATVFSLGTAIDVNANGGTYVAYLFAHDAGGFGLTGTDNVISCGSFTTNANGDATVTLGYEPQWLLLKPSSAVGAWYMYDIMRGLPVTASSSKRLSANTSAAEVSGAESIYPTATGFTETGQLNGNTTYIYIAIRRGPMKTPTSGTSVYNALDLTGTGSTVVRTGVGFTPDIIINRAHTNDQTWWADRLRGVKAVLGASNTNAETGLSSSATQDLTSLDMNGFTFGSPNFTGFNNSGSLEINWLFKRAPGFFDEVCYTGTGSATTFNHNLGVAPELMIVKNRSAATNWFVYSSALGATKYLNLNQTSASATATAAWNDTAPTTSVFTVGTSGSTNGNTEKHVAYLFATVSGVSKVGSYTGTGTTKQIDCGFTGGARFVLIKRTDSTGDWYVWDSARGIVAGNDPYLLLNSTAAEVTTDDSVDTDSTGFIVNQVAATNINVSAATYIFLAIA